MIDKKCKYKAWISKILKDHVLIYWDVVDGVLFLCDFENKTIILDKSKKKYHEQRSTVTLLNFYGLYPERMSQYKLSFLHEIAHALSGSVEHDQKFDQCMLFLMLKYAPKRARRPRA